MVSDQFRKGIHLRAGEIRHDQQNGTDVGMARFPAEDAAIAFAPDCPCVFQTVQRTVDYPEIDLVAIHDLLNGKKAFVFMEVLKFLIQQPVQPVHLHLQLSHTEIQPFRVVFSPITSVLIIYSCRFFKSSRLPQKFSGTARGFCNADTVRMEQPGRLPVK